MTVMHLPDAVDQHHKWLGKLTASLRGEANELQEHEVTCDNMCVIGQWLHGDGMAFEDLHEFQTVKKLHKHVHDIATEAWVKKENDQLDDAEPFLQEIKEAGHKLFMSWNELNLQIGALD